LAGYNTIKYDLLIIMQWITLSGHPVHGRIRRKLREFQCSAHVSYFINFHTVGGTNLSRFNTVLIWYISGLFVHIIRILIFNQKYEECQSVNVLNKTCNAVKHLLTWW